MRLDGGYRAALWGWLVICRVMGPGLCQDEPCGQVQAQNFTQPPLSVVYLAWAREDGAGPAFEASISLYYSFPLVYVTDDGVWDGVEGGGRFSEKSSEVIFLRLHKRYLSEIRSNLCEDDYSGKLGVRYQCDRVRDKTTCEITFLKNDTVILTGRYLDHIYGTGGTLRIEYTDPEAGMLQNIFLLGPDKKTFGRNFAFFYDYWVGVHNRFLSRVNSGEHHMNVMFTMSRIRSSVTCIICINMPVRFYIKIGYPGIEPITVEANDILFFNGSVSASATVFLDFPKNVSAIPVTCDVYSKTRPGDRPLTHTTLVTNPKLTVDVNDIDVGILLLAISLFICLCLLIYVSVFTYRLVFGVTCSQDRDQKQKVL
ncbi:m148.5 protein [Murid betaherpesvirus 1]|nr:m148.5 protein [Murid betaherpesvirus 1]